MGRPLVAVLVGTDHHPFDRLIDLAESATSWTTAEWFVQYGYSSRPVDLPAAQMLAAGELESLLMRARAVVTHGGPGLIMEARAAGHVPVVVPRDPAYGEHVDGHQLRFSARIARDGLIRQATTSDEFETALARALVAGRGEGDNQVAPRWVSAEISRMVDELVHGA